MIHSAYLVTSAGIIPDESPAALDCLDCRHVSLVSRAVDM
jgi:hypothetical protein